jgi:hypothetical protein
VVGTPFGWDSTDSSKHYKGWTDIVAAAELDAGYILVRPEKAVLRDLDLSKFNSVLLSADALVFQTPEDVKRVKAFVAEGGRVVVAANHFFVGSVKGANAVLENSGLEVLDQEPPPAQKGVTLSKEHFSAEVVKAGVESVAFFRASAIDVQKGGRILVNAPYDKAGLGLVATSKLGRGDFIALGTSLWCFWVSEGEGRGQAQGSDNAKLLKFLLAPPRKG